MVVNDMNMQRAAVFQMLGACGSPSGAIDCWLRHAAVLEGCQLIYSSPGAAPGSLPQTRQLSSNGYLRSAFAHDGLWFIDNNSIGGFALTGEWRVPVSYSVTLDLNAVNYLTNLVSGTKTEKVARFVESLRFLLDSDCNWDAQMYFFENSLEAMTSEKQAKMRATALALQRLKHVDRDASARAERIVAKLSDQELEGKADQIMHGYLRAKGSAIWTEVIGQYQACYAILLKCAQIQFSTDSGSLQHKSERLVQFMHEELGGMFINELVYGCHYFREGTRCAFFSKVQRGHREILRTLRNMAWDLQALRQLTQHPLDIPQDGRFFITYLLSYDQGLGRMLDVLPSKALIFSPGSRHAVPLPVRDSRLVLADDYRISERAFERYFSGKAAAERHGHRELFRSRLNATIDELESAVVRTLDRTATA